MQIAREEMLAALELVEPAIARADTIEEMAHVWFSGATITAGNDEGLGIQVPYKAEFKGGIRGALLIGLLTNSRAKEISLEPAGKGSMMLKASAKVELSLLPMEKCLVETPNLKKASKVPFKPNFKNSLQDLMVSVGNPKSANIEELDPAVADANIVRKRIDNAKIDTAISNSFGFGGTNASLVFQRHA